MGLTLALVTGEDAKPEPKNGKSETQTNKGEHEALGKRKFQECTPSSSDTANAMSLEKRPKPDVPEFKDLSSDEDKVVERGADDGISKAESKLLHKESNTMATSPDTQSQKESNPANDNKETHVAAEAEDLENTASAGLLVWASQRGHPDWPAMMTYDPTNGYLKKGNSPKISYHVQFFGHKYTRAWVTRKDLRPWGIDKAPEVVPKKTKGKKKKSNKKKGATGKKQAELEVAITQAMKAAGYRQLDRLSEYVGEYNKKWETVELDSDPEEDDIEGSKIDKKQMKKVKDPNRPKKWKSPFFVFLQERREEFTAKAEKVTDVAKLAGEAWKTLSEEQREPYNKAAEKDKARYEKQMKTYVPPPETYVLKKQKKDPNKPKRAMAPYNYYVQEQVRSLQEQGLPQKDMMHKVAEMWKVLSKDQRAVYEGKAVEDKGRYQAEMLIYKEKLAAEEKANAPEASPSPTPESAKEQNPPPAPPTPASLYIASKKEDESMKSMKDEELKAMWEKEEEDIKTEFVKKATAALEEYEKYVAAGKLIATNTTEKTPTNDKKRKNCGSSKEESKAKKSKNERMCSICCSDEFQAYLVNCTAGCKRAFHPWCLGLEKILTDFKCDACVTGNQRCFICDRGGDLRGCDAKGCLKFYHLECAKKFPRSTFEVTEIEGEKFQCPLHMCGNCELGPTKKHKMWRCLKCPTVYHEICIPAAAQVLGDMRIVCPRHFKAAKEYSAQMCVLCGIGGTLFCCDSCPGTYHMDCLKNCVTQPKEGEDWFCYDCIAGVRPLIHDVVWVKFGVHRWWPSVIQPSEEAPVKVANSIHNPGDFLVRFCGGQEWGWVNTNNTIPWGDNDENRHFAKASKKAYFLKAVKEAAILYGERKEIRRSELDEIRGNVKAVAGSFTRIRANRYNCDKPPKIEVTECSCTPENPCMEDCYNRMTMIECDPKTCPAGDKCQNNRMLKRQYAKVKEFKTDLRGFGLKTKEDIFPGDFVIEYVGEVVDGKECLERLAKQEKAGTESFYIMSLDNDIVIDARLKANMARYANHSCDPNCVTQKWNVAGEMRVGLFAKKFIAAGEEITFDYQLDCLDNKKEKKVCYCGAGNCSGFIGVKPKENKESGKAKKVPKKKKKISKAKKEQMLHEDFCFDCKEQTDPLVMCDFKDCPRCFCLDCLQVQRVPSGVWHCPWHFCNAEECGQKSKVKCETCPNSFCAKHIPEDHVDGSKFQCSKCTGVEEGEGESEVAK
eukprot:m.48850 g.48850  ORF g.48850 m.48850 type:complete len:1232 (-) comp10589_c0_seq1:188-3883(-)